jgi:uncharacterized membrane protein
MSQLVAIAYPDEHQAAEVMEVMARLHEEGIFGGEGIIDLEDAAAVSKDGEGRIKLEGAISRTAAGAASGLFFGSLIGLVFFMPMLGMLFGAAAGALAGKFADLQHIDDFVLQVGDNMPPGSSAILMLVRRADPEKALAVLRQYGGTVIRTTLPDDAEARIRAALAGSSTGTA